MNKSSSGLEGDGDATGGDDSTIVLDSTGEVEAGDASTAAAADQSKAASFKPVKPGGKLLLDETVELSESEDEDDKEASRNGDASPSAATTMSQDSRYVTSVQSPPGGGQLSFHTPGGFHSSTGIHDQTSNGNNSVQTSMTVIQDAASNGGGASNHGIAAVVDPFQIEDEFCKESAGDMSARATEAPSPSSLVNNSGQSLNQSSSSFKRKRVETEDDEEEEEESEEEEEDGQDGDDERDESSLLLPHFGKRVILGEDSLPKTCTVLRTPSGGVVYLVGTAHFSKESNDDVSRVVRASRPDAVLLELCPGRTDILRLDEETLAREGQDLTAAKMVEIVRRYGKVQGVMYILMLSMSAKLTRELGMAPGGEFRAACK